MTRSPTEALLIAITRGTCSSQFCESTTRFARFVHVIVPPQKMIVISPAVYEKIDGFPTGITGIRNAFSEIVQGLPSYIEDKPKIGLACGGGLLPSIDVVINADNLDTLRYLKYRAHCEVEDSSLDMTSIK